MTFKCFFICGLFLFSLVGCTNQVGSSKSNGYNQKSIAVVDTSFPSNSLYNIGGTYDTSSGMSTHSKTCSIYGNNLNNVQIISPSASIDFSQSIDSKTVKRAFGFDFEAKINLGFKTLRVAHHYAKTSQDDDFTMNINYVYKLSGKAIFNDGSDVQGIKSLTNEAQQALKNSPDSFRKMCGDKIVSELDAGAIVLMKLTLNFASRSEKKSFDSSTSSLGGINGVLAKLKQKQNGTKFTITASALQLGGNPDLLTQLFIRHGGNIDQNGYPALNCSGVNGDDKDCVGLINEVIDYANTLKAQLNNKSDYYYSSPVLSSWGQLGVNILFSERSITVQSALYELYRIIENDSAKEIFINNYLQLLNKTPNVKSQFIRNIYTIQDLYKKLIANYDDTRNQLAENCGVGYLNNRCIDSVNKTKLRRQQILDNYEVILPLESYIMSNIYYADLKVNTSENKIISCDVYPSSGFDVHKFLINCDGHIINNVQNGLTILRNEKSLTLNNLSYNYKIGESDALFKYGADNKIELLLDDMSTDLYEAEVSLKENDFLVSGSEPLIFIKKLF
ncbi:MAG: hypothetical protein PHC75_06870 [Burkholderiales bacterium]|nr:hypothetical protein [Burkholderiales bacterium]